MLLCASQASALPIMANIASSGEGWYERLLDRLARLRLITRTFEAREQLTPLEFAEFMAMAGITLRRPHLINEPATADRWHVNGQIILDPEESEVRMLIQRIYLFGQHAVAACHSISLTPKS